MIVVRTGDEHAVRGALRRFAEEMDRGGHPYGHSGTDFDVWTFDRQATLGQEYSSDTAHALAVVEGCLYALGPEGRVLVEAGHAVWWPAGEPWAVDVPDHVMVIEVEGPLLRSSHLG